MLKIKKQHLQSENEIEIIIINKIEKKYENLINDKDFSLSEFLDNKKIFIFIKNKKILKYDELKKMAKIIFEWINKRKAFINLNQLENSDEEIIDAFFEVFYCDYEYNFSYRTEKNKEKNKEKKENFQLILISEFENKKNEIDKIISINMSKNFARKFQDMPPNIANSEYIANQMRLEFENLENVSINILTRSKIQSLKMNLFLAVNKGSSYEPRLVEINYHGDPNSKEKNIIVGKGITFDSGGYNLKPSKYLMEMKFDMSGAIIAAAVLKSLQQLKAKVNLSILMMLTDNKISSNSVTPEEIYYAMNNKSVEITDIDAEGRLVLADGLVYASRILKGTNLFSIATLTGSVVVALGNKITGVWSTNDKIWNNFNQAANISHEKVWRLPLDEIFLEGLTKSKLADLKNYDSTSMSDANSAAMFLKQFTDEKNYMHIDIAGTANKGNISLAVMVKTLVNYFLTKK